jgi:hypothetical protein
LAAQDAAIFWDGRFNPAVVSVRSASAPDALGRTEPVRWAEFQCAIRTYRDETGATHVLLQRDGRAVQLLVHGDPFEELPLHAIFETETLGRAKIIAPVLARLESFQSLPSVVDQGHVSQLEDHLRHYVIALDGTLAGASYRQIAQTIYGPDRVADAWTIETSYLKNRTRRAVERGLALMNGGYLSLLR